MINSRAIARSRSEILQLDAKIPIPNQEFEVPPKPQKKPQRSGPAADWQLHNVGSPSRKHRVGCETRHGLSDTLGSKVSGVGGARGFWAHLKRRSFHGFGSLNLGVEKAWEYIVDPDLGCDRGLL